MQTLRNRLPLALAAAGIAAAALALPPGTPAPEKAEKPDITSRGGLRIGSVLIPWGSVAAVEVKASDASPSGAQACAVNATYEMTNLAPDPRNAAVLKYLRSLMIAKGGGAIKPLPAVAPPDVAKDPFA